MKYLQDLVVRILLGKFLCIINNPKQHDNNFVSVAGSLGKELIQNYFYLLYCKNKKQRSGRPPGGAGPAPLV